MIKITEQILKEIMPNINNNPKEWADLCNEFFPKYQITTPQRIAGFLAQAAVESSQMNVLVENLNYSAEGLVKTFPRYFPSLNFAQSYHRKPELIANRVYDDANRTKTSKLGNTQKGDGWRFRGRGIFQLTGRDNYTRFGQHTGNTAESAAMYLETKKGAMHSACWYWQTRNLQAFADRSDIDGMSKAVNGGTHGLTDRRNFYGRALNVLNKQPVTAPAPSKPTPAPTSIWTVLSNLLTNLKR